MKCWECGRSDTNEPVREGLCLDCWCRMLNLYLGQKHGRGSSEWAVEQAGIEARKRRSQRMNRVEKKRKRK